MIQALKLRLSVSYYLFRHFEMMKICVDLQIFFEANLVDLKEYF